MHRIKDLREFIRVLASIGELQEIDVATDLKLEIGAIIRRTSDLKAPAPLFNNIKGVETGFRILGGSAGLSGKKGFKFSRIAVALSFPPDTDANTIVNTLSDSMTRKGVPL
jgi:UbiD family decarboxylase